MRILLINPPFYRFLNSHNNDSRIGLGYLSAVLLKAGYDVLQYNPDYLSKTEYANQAELFESSLGFNDAVKKPYHPVYKEIYNTIDKLKPDVVGMTVMAGTVTQAETIAKYCHDHDIRVMVGGTMVTLALSEMAKNNFFHQLIPGEGEKVIVQAIEHPERRFIVGVNTTNLDTLPFPTRDNFVGDTTDMSHGSIQTARGCNMKCVVAGTPISTLDGKIPIEELKEGDEINAFNGSRIQQTQVKETFNRLADNVYILETEQGKLELTGDHRVYTKRGWIEVKDLTEEDEILCE